MVAEVEGWESPSAVLGTGGLSLDSSGLTCPLQKKHPAQVCWFISLLTIISEL